MKKLNKNVTNIFFILSLLIFLSSAINTNFGYLKDRSYPFAFDNYFGFLIKSKNFDLCVNDSGCKGLQSIEKQIENFSDPQNHKVERLKAQVFKIYHPVYSLSISAINFIINDIFISLNIINIFFIIIVIFSIIKFTIELFSKEVATLLLVLFSVNNYHGWGYASHINPFVLSQAFSMLVFYFLLKNKKNYVIIFNILASLTHPIGIFTNAISIFFVFFSSYKKSFKDNLIIIPCLFLILFIYFNDLSFFENINLRNSKILDKDYNFFSLMYGNISKFFFVFNPMIKPYGLAILVACSLFFISHQKIKNKTLLILLIYIMTLMTVIFDKPFITLPQRFMNITGIILLGSFIYSWIYLINRFVNIIDFKKFSVKNFNNNNISNFILKDFSILIVPIFFIFYFQNIFNGIFYYKDYFSYFDKNYNVNFSKKQIKLIKDNSHLIFDNSERADYFYMLNGLHKNNYFYYNFLPLDNEILLKENIYLITLSPLYSKKYNSDLFFSKNSTFKIINKEEKSIFLKFEIYKDTTFKLNNKEFKYIKTITDKKVEKVIPLYLVENEFEVIDGKIKITSLGDFNNLNLPWGKDIFILFEKQNINKKISFKQPFYSNCKIEIINDEGTSVLSKISECS